MLSRPLLVALALLCLASPGLAAGWARHENRALIQDSRAGWAVETPADWVAIPDVQPPAPLGQGFRSNAGDSGVIVTFVERLPGGEMEGLQTRGYTEETCRIAGHEDLDREWLAASDDPQRRVRRKLDPGPLFPWSRVLASTTLKRFEPQGQ